MSALLTVASTQVRMARRDDIPAIAQVLARAFAGDPALSLVVPQDEHRHQHLVAGMDAYLRYGSNRLSDTFASSDLAGAAIWMPPGDLRQPIRDSLGLIRGSVHMCGWRRIATFMRADSTLDEHLARQIPGPTYYLGVLGVEPSRQGQGIGSALMRPVLDRCDRDRILASLWTFTEANLSFYARHGFRVVEELTLPRTTVAAWLLRRDPA